MTLLSSFHLWEFGAGRHDPRLNIATYFQIVLYVEFDFPGTFLDKSRHDIVYLGFLGLYTVLNHF